MSQQAIAMHKGRHVRVKRRTPALYARTSTGAITQMRVKPSCKGFQPSMQTNLHTTQTCERKVPPIPLKPVPTMKHRTGPGPPLHSAIYNETTCICSFALYKASLKERMRSIPPRAAFHSSFPSRSILKSGKQIAAISTLWRCARVPPMTA